MIRLGRDHGLGLIEKKSAETSDFNFTHLLVDIILNWGIQIDLHATLTSWPACCQLYIMMDNVNVTILLNFKYVPNFTSGVKPKGPHWGVIEVKPRSLF